MPTDIYYMSHAIVLAERGAYTVRQNPRVGCVIVKNDQVIAEGWHQEAGGPHAEIMALQHAGNQAKDATCYITLEPCVHSGKTPPCVLPLIEAGIKRVVIASLDPNPVVYHKGVDALRAAGINVEVGLLANDAYELNKGFFQRMKNKRPYVRVKMGLSLDGRTALANGKSQWITGEGSRQDVQYWRARSCAVLTSSQTVLDDNPKMNVRDPVVKQTIEAETNIALRQPWRIVLDANLRTSPDMEIYQGADKVTVITRKETEVTSEWKNISVVSLPSDKNGKLDLKAVMSWLSEQEINEVWVEAGPSLVGALREAGLVDEWVLYIAPKFLGNDARPLLKFPELTELTQTKSLEFLECKSVGSDLRIIAKEKV